MKNAVGREIPDEILKLTGKDVYRGTHHFDGTEFKKDGPITRVVINSDGSKLVDSIHDVLVKCGIKDGMRLGFHHHFRNGDKVLNLVMEEVHKMGIKDITLCASSLGAQNDPILPMIEDGTITNIESSGVRGSIGQAISEGKLKGLAIMRSHGGRVRAIESGEAHVDISFIGAPTADEYGNLAATGGKANCGVLSYSAVDAMFADKVVAITDTLVPFPNLPAQITQTYIDYVVVVDEIGDPKKIATGAAKPTTDQRKLLMAKYCTDFVVETPYFKEGFSYQTGVGGASIASTLYLAEIMREKGIHMSFGVGGIAKPMCDLLDEGLIHKLVDTQDFDEPSIRNIEENPNHYYITAGEYANPFNKGAYVNKLDFVILASLEVDTHFNCNVVVGSDGVITGAQGGHPDTAAGAKCTIVIAPIMQGRMPTICTDVTTVTTPGEDVDVVVTDYGIAINPRRQDLIEATKGSKLPLKTIEELRDIAYAITGEPEPVQFGDRVVGIIEARDGTIMDVVRQIKKFEFKD
jgi:citrate lyase subunit alpha/citrate CoA-transferase